MLFRYLVSRPSCVTGFGKLLRNAKVAQVQLAEGLEEILPQLVRYGVKAPS